MAYCTIAQVKQRIQKTNVDADAFLPQIIAAAERTINNVVNRPDGFEAVVATRYFPGNGKAFILIDENVTITAVAVKDSATDTSYEAWTSPTAPQAGDGDWLPFSGDPNWPDFNSTPYDALMVDPGGDQSQFTSGRYVGLAGFPRREGTLNRQVPTVRIAASWGYSLVAPDDIVEACVMQTTIWYKRMQGSMATILASSELGTLELFGPLDPAIELILRLGRYMRPASGRR